MDLIRDHLHAHIATHRKYQFVFSCYQKLGRVMAEWNEGMRRNERSPERNQRSGGRRERGNEKEAEQQHEGYGNGINIILLMARNVHNIIFFRNDLTSYWEVSSVS
ncbi:hypothetical protein K435DRAFT_798443 [Dendrothele bispora CBS 962.96]|uniref:Uncharacterized protein n=1 Tax=Dendrothele bispora (strain CBS 962.96) TaxID=1314807 RepID=A0A4S8M0C4_DENBC|nr:hypothetical protein K435DRAFT_798443 [Dendrothele bispora CBS 962.96]